MGVNPLWVYVTMGVTIVKGFRICSNQIKIKQVMSLVFLAKTGWVPSNNAPRLGSESQLCTAGVKNYAVLVLVLCQNIGLKRIVIGITDLGFGFIKKNC